MLRIKLVRSTIGYQPATRNTVQALGLRKIHQVVEHEDTPSIRGMLHRVKNMLEIEDENGNRPFADARTVTKRAPRRDRLPGSSGDRKR